MTIWVSNLDDLKRNIWKHNPKRVNEKFSWYFFKWGYEFEI